MPDKREELARGYCVSVAAALGWDELRDELWKCEYPFDMLIQKIRAEIAVAADESESNA